MHWCIRNKTPNIGTNYRTCSPVTHRSSPIPQCSSTRCPDTAVPSASACCTPAVNLRSLTSSRTSASSTSPKRLVVPTVYTDKYVQTQNNLTHVRFIKVWLWGEAVQFLGLLVLGIHDVTKLANPRHLSCVRTRTKFSFRIAKFCVVVRAWCSTKYSHSVEWFFYKIHQNNAKLWF